MATKNLLLMSLEDDKIKQIANVLSNDSCRKILDYLSEHDATESEFAEKLQLPISTVHYNIEQLQKAGLVSGDEFHYSQKGREIVHYKLANKYIIISPKKTTGIKEKLKAILPVALISFAAAGLIQFANKFGISATEQFAAKSMMMESAENAPAMMMDTMQKTAEASQYPNIALWFLLGALFALIVFIIISLLKKEKK